MSTVWFCANGVSIAMFSGGEWLSGSDSRPRSAASNLRISHAGDHSTSPPQFPPRTHHGCLTFAPLWGLVSITQAAAPSPLAHTTRPMADYTSSAFRISRASGSLPRYPSWPRIVAVSVRAVRAVRSRRRAIVSGWNTCLLTLLCSQTLGVPSPSPIAKRCLQLPVRLVFRRGLFPTLPSRTAL